MDVSSFFRRLVQPAKAQGVFRQADDPGDFATAWKAVQETLEHPDERQIVRGISSTDVPSRLSHIVDALVYENSRNNGDETGPCFEYLIRNDLLSTLVKLAEPDRPHGVKGEVVRSMNNLIVLLSDRFLNHSAVHGPLRRLLRSCIGDDPVEGRSEEVSRVFGAAGMEYRRGARDEDAEADLVDLMCILCSKMRAYPPLLLIFFHDKTPTHPGAVPRSDALLAHALSPTPSTQTSLSHPSRQSQSSRAGLQRFEFLLFSYLLRFVHREGRTGDFARAGLLFLFDIAFLPVHSSGDYLSDGQSRKGENDALQDAQDALGEYILDGDFAAVMAAALGAVYSLLPSKLSVPNLAEQAELAGDDDEASASGGLYLGQTTKSSAKDLPCTTYPDVRSQLDLLLKLFAFLQDIITRCSSSALAASAADSTLSNTHILGAAVSDSALDAIQTSFLDNILYPSILESSASDGTSVAVMIYLHVMLSNIDDGPLLTRLLHFLLDTDSDDAPRLAPHHQPKRDSKAAAAVDDVRTDYFVDTGKFTIKDLIVDNLSVANPASRSAALQLLQTMLQEHCASSVDGLLSITRLLLTDDSPQASYPPEFRLYSSLLSSLHPSAPPFDQSLAYATYFIDIQNSIQSDRCFRLDQLDDTLADSIEKAEIARAKRKSVLQHKLSPDDPIIREIMLGLAGWMTRTADENVILASVIISLAGCSRRCLDGWLTMGKGPEGNGDPWNDQTSRSERGSVSVDNDPFAMPWTPHPPAPTILLPAIYQLLQAQIAQIAHLRKTMSHFDVLLAERRHGLLFADNLDEAMALNIEMDAFGSMPTSPGGLVPPPITPVRRGRPSLAGSIKGFFSPRKNSAGSSTPTSKETPRTPGEDGVEATEGIYAAPEVQGAAITIDSTPISDLVAGPWAVYTPRRPGTNRSLSAWSKQDEGRSLSFSFSRTSNGLDEDEGDTASRKVEVTQILDNVVILEEFLKEIIAVITARRALRIDPVCHGH